MDDLLELLQNASPELVDALLQYGMVGPENELQKKRYEGAEGDANAPMPRGGEVRNGIFVAPHGLEILNSTMRQVVGAKQQEAALQAQQANLLRRFPAIHGMIAHKKKMMDQQGAQDEASMAAGQEIAPLVPDIPADTTGMDIKHDFGPYLRGGGGAAQPPGASGPRRANAFSRPDGPYKPLPWEGPGQVSGVPWYLRNGG